MYCLRAVCAVVGKTNRAWSHRGEILVAFKMQRCHSLENDRTENFSFTRTVQPNLEFLFAEPNPTQPNPTELQGHP